MMYCNADSVTHILLYKCSNTEFALQSSLSYRFFLLQQPTEEDPDEGIKDLVEITLKKMVS